MSKATTIPDSQALNVLETSLNSIIVSWNGWAGATDAADSLNYQIGITEEENPADPWHIVKEGKEFHRFTFKDLKEDTSYGIFVKAFDETGLVCQYPVYRGCLTVRTKAPDLIVPTVSSNSIRVTAVSYDSISIEWEPATDNDTEQDKIRYKVWLRPYGASSDAWKTVVEKRNLSSFTFTGLNLDTRYDFYVEAFDEAGNVLRYPNLNGFMSADTLADKAAPTVNSRNIKVTDATLDSISIQWEPATDNVTQQSKIRYQVWCTMHNVSTDPWKKVEEKTGLTSYTFKGLKEATTYAFYVRAFDEAGNFLQYPLDNGSMTRSTASPDTLAPTAKSREIKVTDTTRNSISIQWEPATDNVTQQSKIRYQVWYKLDGVPSDPWKKVEEKPGLTSYTFKGLKEATEYIFYVRAFDEAGNFLQYPLDNGSKLAKTASSDAKAPTVKNREIKVTATTRNSISIQWEPATDNVTQQSKIRYEVWCTMSNVSSDPWKKVEDKPGISSYTFTGLKEATEYSIFVKAFDEAGNYLQYPLDNGSKRAKTASSDTKAPTVKSRDIKVTATTRNSISIQWEPATDNVTQQSKIRYQVWCKMEGVPSDPWKKVEEKTGISSYTFTGLKEATSYIFYVDAIDEAGNTLSYPLDNGSMMAKTASSDTKAPTVKNRDIKVTATTRNSISIQWEPATDNVTQQSKIRYQVWCTMHNVSTDPWKKVEEKTGLTSYTFKGLKEATTYAFYVRAFDEAGNFLQYPLDNGSMTAKTASSDTKAPTVKSRDIKVTATTRNSISIQWEPATDNVTQQSKIRYQVWCTMIDVPGDTWKKVAEKQGISSYTLSNLKAATNYGFYVEAFDEAGNTLSYPLDNGCMTAKTKA